MIQQSLLLDRPDLIRETLLLTADTDPSDPYQQQDRQDNDEQERQDEGFFQERWGWRLLVAIQDWKDLLFFVAVGRRNVFLAFLQVDLFLAELLAIPGPVCIVVDGLRI